MTRDNDIVVWVNYEMSDEKIAILQLQFDCNRQKKAVDECVKEKNESDPDVIRTRNLLIWSQTRYRCATESAEGYAPQVEL